MDKLTQKYEGTQCALFSLICPAYVDYHDIRIPSPINTPSTKTFNNVAPTSSGSGSGGDVRLPVQSLADYKHVIPYDVRKPLEEVSYYQPNETQSPLVLSPMLFNDNQAGATTDTRVINFVVSI